MIALQVLSKVILSKDNSFLDDNLLTVEYFVGYEHEYEFIVDHIREYGNVPDKATFLAKFPEIELVEVTESDKYLIDAIREEYLYYKSVPVVQHIAELLKSDSNAAAEYMVHAMQELEPNYRIGGTNIITQAEERFAEFIDRRDNQDKWYFTTGFEELDGQIHGIQRKEEFFVIVARVNQGKSWVIEKICTHIWQIGFNVGYVSPEMGASSVGYRFDTLHKHFSNRDLMWGKKDLDEENYKSYIDSLHENQNKFIVATPLDFQKKITVSKLRNWVKQYKLDLIAVDGITYLSDERYRRGDTKTISLTNISEDLMALSIELGVPVIVVVQSNRGGVQEENAPELENIRDSDGIAHNASKVLSIRQLPKKEGGLNNVLRMEIKKQRFGPVGGRLDYVWDIDKGDFQFIPSNDDAESEEQTERKVENLKKQYKDSKVVF